MTQNKSEKPLISVKHVRKIYRMGEEKVVALDDVSLDIYKGEIVCFLGTSGSGKSTFLNMVAGLEKPSKGEIIIGGVPIHKLNEERVTLFRQKNIGFIFQAYHLMPMMTALENVSLPLIFQGMDKKKREKISREVMAAVGLKGYEKRKPTQMSGGQQQRVGIARALVGTPKIIFADEPTGNLDTNTTKEVMDLIVRQVKRHGQTLILVTHDRSIAAYADKVVTIQDGNILHVRENRHPAVMLEEQEPAAGQEETDGTDPAGGQKPAKEQERPKGLKLTKEPISADERTPNETIETEGPKTVSDRDEKKDAQHREAGISKGNKEEAQ
ncbi:ABC transporter ATP-binding protein [Bacilliculturomica massiliensis]|uniref:ABC transporter ATP-binding protein n=1 Tax=Bacilliculturomica massiliensis TaxID=1917867 RepID=UPI001031E00B